MTTILILLVVAIIVLALVIRSMDKQLTIMVEELNAIWKVLTELRENETQKTRYQIEALIHQWSNGDSTEAKYKVEAYKDLLELLKV